MSGRLIADGDIDPALGSAIWMVGDLSTGRYIVTGYDDSGQVISFSSIVKS